MSSSTREWMGGPNFRMIRRGSDGRGVRGEPRSPYGDGKNRPKRFHPNGQNPLMQRASAEPYVPQRVFKTTGEFKPRRHHT